jgi:hypothetical protein
LINFESIYKYLDIKDKNNNTILIWACSNKMNDIGLDKCIGKNVLLNDIYNIVNDNLEYLEFLYIIQNINKYECICIGGEYYIKDYRLKHLDVNIYEQFINDNIIIDNNLSFTSIDIIINRFKYWYTCNYNYLKLPFKVDIKKEILQKMINKYGMNMYNNMKKIGWTNIKIKN